MKKALFCLALFLLILPRLDRYFCKTNGSFSPVFIYPKWAKCLTLETEMPPQVEAILEQPFTYLTKGKQSFVFISQDQEWVLKFFRLPRYTRRYCLKNGKKEGLFDTEKTFRCFYYAQTKLAEETNILYSHLQKTENLGHVKIIDSYHFLHSLPLDDLPFAIQSAGTPIFSHFSPHKAQSIIEKTLSLYASLYRKGFIDQDPIFEKNFGMKKGEPFIIDVGQVTKAASLPPIESYLRDMTHSLRVYLTKHAPNLLPLYEQKLLAKKRTLEREFSKKCEVHNEKNHRSCPSIQYPLSR